MYKKEGKKMYVCMYGQWLMWPIFTIISVKKKYIYIYIYTCMLHLHACSSWKEKDTNCDL